MHRCTAEAARRLGGDERADPAPLVAELETLLGRVRLSLAPLVHPMSPLRARRTRARQVMELLDVCAREIKGLSAVAADPQASHDARLTAACLRVETAVHALVPPCSAARHAMAFGPAPQHHPGAEAALRHLHGLERALVDLAAPVRTSPRSPLVPAA